MNSTTKLRLGLVGCGGRGRIHMDAALKTGLYELSAISDPNAERLERFKADFKPARAFDDFRTMLSQRGSIDVLHVCTQPTLREEPIRAAVEAGVKAIVVEKPVALSLSHTRTLAGICAEGGVLLVVNYQKRNFPEWMAFKDAIAAGKLGQVSMVRGSCYGNLLAQGSHILDMAWNILGEPAPKSVFAACDERIGMPDSHPAPLQTIAQVEFANGVRAVFSMGEETPVYPNSESVYYYFNMDALGTLGRAEAVLDQGFRRWDKAGALVETLSSRWVGPNQAAAQGQLNRDIHRALQDPAFKHPQRVEAALVSMKLAEAIARSALARKPIHFPVEGNEDALLHWSPARSERLTVNA